MALVMRFPVCLPPYMVAHIRKYVESGTDNVKCTHSVICGRRMHHSRLMHFLGMSLVYRDMGVVLAQPN